jgi:hypothetical protein
VIGAYLAGLAGYELSEESVFKFGGQQFDYQNDG